MLGKFVYSVTMETNSIKSFCVALDVLVRRAGHVRLQGETATKLGKQLLKCFVTHLWHTHFFSSEI